MRLLPKMWRFLGKKNCALFCALFGQSRCAFEFKIIKNSASCFSYLVSTYKYFYHKKWPPQTIMLGFKIFPSFFGRLLLYSCILQKLLKKMQQGRKITDFSFFHTTQKRHDFFFVKMSQFSNI